MLIHLTNLDEVNKVLKLSKKKDFQVLYVSSWDTWSDKILSLAEERSMSMNLYVINSWDTPSAFGTYKIMSAPSLLISTKGNLRVITEYSSVYNWITESANYNSDSAAPLRYRTPITEAYE